MGEMKDQSIHIAAERFTSEMDHMKMFKTFYQDLQVLVASASVTRDNFKESLLKAMKECNMENELKNTIFHWLRSRKSVSVPKEPLSYIRKAQAQWEKRIHKSLNSMANEIKVPLAQMRSSHDKKELNEKWQQLSIYDTDLSQYRPVYAPKDFMHVLLSIRSPNYKPISLGVLEHPLDKHNTMYWDFVHLPFKVKSLKELKTLYNEIVRSDSVLGIHATMRSFTHFPPPQIERIDIGEKVLSCGHAPLTLQYLKNGAPRSLRAKLWSQVLGSEVKPGDEEYFKILKERVLQYDLMIDKLIIKDVQLTASNDHQFFVFEDVLYQIMLCFSRDPEVLNIFNSSSATPVHGVIKGRQASLENTVVYPPCGIIPFHGFTMYATPFCYLYDDPVALYYTFRAFYMRYLFRLHEVSSSEQGILSLCILFERLLQKHEYELWMHFKNISIRPTQLVFKWMIKAFCGFLIPDQLLYLWDVILAYDSLEVIPLLSVAILSLRRTNLLSVNTLPALEAILADLSTILALPMIQLSLIRFDALHSSKPLISSEEDIPNLLFEDVEWEELEDEEEEEDEEELYSTSNSSETDNSSS